MGERHEHRMDALTEAVARQIRSRVLGPIGDEDTLQAVVAHLLAEADIVAAREVRLSDQDRIDFLVPERVEAGGTARGLGIEVKVDGSAAALIRQLHRYAQHDAIAALLVVTTRAQHTTVPREISGVPIRVCSLLENAL